MENFDLYTKSIVIDMGSAQIKAGFCTNETPKVVFESVKSSTSAFKVLPTPFAKKRIGLPATSNYFHKFERLIERGVLLAHENADLIIAQILAELKVKNVDETSLLFCNPVNAPLKQNAYLVEHCLEKLGLNGVGFVNQPLLPLFAQGATTGMVLELGDGLAQTAAMVSGLKIGRTSAFSLLGGKDVDAALARLLRLKGHEFSASKEFMIVRQIKERLCRVQCAGPPEGEASAAEESYVCPDGELVSLGSDGAHAAEVLFEPALAGSAARSLPQLVQSVLGNVDVELVRPLSQNVLLSGESRTLRGLSQRLREEVRELTAIGDLRLEAPSREKQFLAWTGAAKLNLNNEFFKSFLKKFEWDEFGESLLARRGL